MKVSLPRMDVEEKLRFAVLPDQLLAWYEKNARELPWRIGPKARRSRAKPDPYRVWLAEIMLQQTTVPHATRYYYDFLSRWPTVDDLAQAADSDVMAAWAGLGYYARARNLLKCAREISTRGAWPETASELKKLPGIGPYTAGAVAALAFGEQSAAVDGNVERVFARLLAAEGDWKHEKKRIADLAAHLVPADRPAEFAEALMDLGATICTPKSPACDLCPLAELCKARALGTPSRFPVKPKRAPNPQRCGQVFVVLDGKGNVLTERRPESGLLGGMVGLPTSAWNEGVSPEVDYPFCADWQLVGQVKHVFTHFDLKLDVWRMETSEKLADAQSLESVEAALPSVFKKALKLAVDKPN